SAVSRASSTSARSRSSSVLLTLQPARREGIGDGVRGSCAIGGREERGSAVVPWHVRALSTPAGIEEFVRTLAEPALWPRLQPPPDGPRVAADRMEAVERQFGMVRHGPPPPPAS